MNSRPARQNGKILAHKGRKTESQEQKTSTYPVENTNKHHPEISERHTTEAGERTQRVKL